MEKKDSRDREREPEEYNFNYEELAGTEDLDTEKTGKRMILTRMRESSSASNPG